MGTAYLEEVVPVELGVLVTNPYERLTLELSSIVAAGDNRISGRLTPDCKHARRNTGQEKILC